LIERAGSDVLNKAASARWARSRDEARALVLQAAGRTVRQGTTGSSKNSTMPATLFAGRVLITPKPDGASFPSRTGLADCPLGAGAGRTLEDRPDLAAAVSRRDACH
jgi:hypothetical protein